MATAGRAARVPDRRRTQGANAVVLRFSFCSGLERTLRSLQRPSTARATAMPTRPHALLRTPRIAVAPLTPTGEPASWRILRTVPATAMPMREPASRRSPDTATVPATQIEAPVSSRVRLTAQATATRTPRPALRRILRTAAARATQTGWLALVPGPRTARVPTMPTPGPALVRVSPLPAKSWRLPGVWGRPSMSEGSWKSS